MRIPTTLHLEADDVDRHVRAASDLVRRDAPFHRLMRDLLVRYICGGKEKIDQEGWYQAATLPAGICTGFR